MRTLTVALILAVILGGAALYQFNEAHTLRRQLAEAEAARDNATNSAVTCGATLDHARAELQTVTMALNTAKSEAETLQVRIEPEAQAEAEAAEAQAQAGKLTPEQATQLLKAAAGLAKILGL